MTNITLSISSELHQKMKKYNEIKWSEVVRKAIRDRDKVCKLCGKQNLLVVHHIDWNKKHSTEDNLILLCRKCHYKVHRNKDKYLQKLLDLVGSPRKVLGT